MWQTRSKHAPNTYENKTKPILHTTKHCTNSMHTEAKPCPHFAQTGQQNSGASMAVTRSLRAGRLAPCSRGPARSLRAGRLAPCARGRLAPCARAGSLRLLVRGAGSLLVPVRGAGSLLESGPARSLCKKRKSGVARQKPVHGNSKQNARGETKVCFNLLLQVFCSY